MSQNKNYKNAFTNTRKKVNINSFTHVFSFFHLEDSVISVFSNKAQEVDAPRVHQLIVGGPCHSAGSLGNAGYHTLAVHLLTRSGGREGLTRFDIGDSKRVLIVWQRW